MNKSLIYSYICELEQELFSVIPNNRFKETIVSEIVTGAIVQLHELDNSSKTDEDTAKGLVLVKEEQTAMTHAVRNHSFKNKTFLKKSMNISLIPIIGGIVIIALISVGIYFYSVSNRYQRINSEIVFDKWTGKSIDVFENMETE